MDGAQFDTLVQSLGRGLSRRSVLGVLLGVLISPLLPAAQTLARRRKRQRKGHRQGHKAADRDRDRNSRHRAEVQADKKKGTRKKPCPSCKKRKQGKCKGTKPDGTACPGGSCQAGRCLPTAVGPISTQPTCSCDGMVCGDDGCGGVCGSCEAGLLCQNGACVLGCDSRLTACGDICANLQSDPAYCGSCTHPCSTVHNTPRCQSGTCVLGMCDAGWDDCDGNPNTGCETNTRIDPDHCGTCETTCTGRDACVEGVCLCQPMGCAAQGKNCGTISDWCGHEISCGTCSDRTPVCVDNVCSACTSHSQCGDGVVCCGGRCLAGNCCDDTQCAALAFAPECDFHQCICQANDFQPCAPDLACCQSGCADLQTDPDHCGTCATTCGPDEFCLTGTCALVPCSSNADCPDGAICDGDICHPCTVTCPSDQTASACGATLQNALDGSTSTIYVCPGTYQGGFGIRRSVSVIGAGQGDDPRIDTILDGIHEWRVIEIYITDNTDVSLARLRITRGHTFSGAGVMHSSGTSLTMVDCTVTDCVAGGSGGGIASVGDLMMTGCTVSNNRFSASAGGVGCWGAAILTDCLIVGNQATSRSGACCGGGLVVGGDSRTTLAGTTEIRGNTAPWGGGIAVDTNASLTIAETCRVTNNTGTSGLNVGGGIYVFDGGTVTLEGADPSPIVVNNCSGNCEPSGAVAKCALTPVSC